MIVHPPDRPAREEGARDAPGALHPELKATFCLDILGVKKNPNGQIHSSPGVITKGTVIEVNAADVSELGLVTPAGKVVWGKYAQVTNNPEQDGVVNAVLLV